MTVPACLGRRFAKLTVEVKTSEFWLTAYAISAFMLALNFFIATAPEQMREFSPVAAVRLTATFSAVLPAGGIVWVPLVGYVVDHLGLLKAWIVLWMCFLCFSLLSFLHAALGLDELAYVAFAVFSFARPLLYTLAASFTAQMFGMRNFGKCYGILFTLAGIMNTNVSDLKLFAELHGFVNTNVLLLLAELLVVALPMLLIWHSRPRSNRRPSEIGRRPSLLLRHCASINNPRL